METALAEGEFEVYLQPKVALKEERVAGAEALVRWRDPERGLVPAKRFYTGDGAEWLYRTDGSICV